MAGFVFAASQNSCAEVCQPDETANPSAQETVQDPPAGTAAQPLTSSEPPLEYAVRSLLDCPRPVENNPDHNRRVLGSTVEQPSQPLHCLPNEGPHS